MNEEQMAVNNAETPTAQTNPVSNPVDMSSNGMAKPERTYTRDEVTNLMKKRVERSHNAFFKRYNVTDLKGLDALFGRIKQFKQMQDEFASIQLKNTELTQQNAFLRNNINPDKYDDILAYFKGKGLAFNEESLLEAIANHPEWLKPSNVPSTTTIKTLGSEAHAQSEPNDLAKASKLLGVKI